LLALLESPTRRELGRGIEPILLLLRARVTRGQRLGPILEGIAPRGLSTAAAEATTTRETTTNARRNMDMEEMEEEVEN
jgi:hypothetical protein